MRDGQYLYAIVGQSGRQLVLQLAHRFEGEDDLFHALRSPLVGALGLTAHDIDPRGLGRRSRATWITSPVYRNCSD